MTAASLAALISEVDSYHQMVATGSSVSATSAFQYHLPDGPSFSLQDMACRGHSDPQFGWQLKTACKVYGTKNRGFKNGLPLETLCIQMRYKNLCSDV